jgi:protoheme IX farnesyltransferase
VGALPGAGAAWPKSSSRSGTSLHQCGGCIMTTPLVDAYEPKRAATTVALGDLVALAKPRITALVLITTVGGYWLAPVKAGPLVATLTTIGTILIVAGANALNMYIERNIDGRMERTKDRPLPAGRMAPRVALWFGVALSVAAVPILAFGANATTALLAVLANLSYVLAYTPLKQRSHWTAATGTIGAGGLVLFGIMFLWQVPHFHAISIFRREEYARAGLQVMPNTLGLRATKHSIARYLFALLAVSLLLVPLGVERPGYTAWAASLGTVFLGWGCWGLREDAGARWARSLFGISILYLMLLFCALMVGAGPSAL